MTLKQLKKFLIEKSKKLNESEKEYLKEELESIDLGSPEWYKVIEIYESGEKCDNPNNIISLYLLNISDYPKNLKHRWELADAADIDLDFSPDGRDDIKDYLRNKYGEDKCVSIGTYGTLGVKGSVQEVSRVFNIPPKEYLTVSKAVSDEDKDLSEQEIREKYPQVDKFLKKYPQVAETMTKLTGMKKSIGCIAGDQLLYNNIKIEELKDGDEVHYVNNNKEIVSNTYGTLIYSGNKKCVKLNFDDGTSLTCTPEHLVYTDNRGYVKAKDLQECDDIVSVKINMVKTKKLISKEDVGIKQVYDISMNIENNNFIDSEPNFIIEGTVVHNSHAGGFVVSSDSLFENIPIVKSSKNWVSGWQESGAVKELEALGFIKVDVLGLAAVEQIKQSVKEINRRYPKNNLPEDIYNVPIDDQKVYDFINSLELDNVFQMESKVFVEAVRKIKPQSLSDISNISTLIRPGAACSVDMYSKSKLDKTKTPKCLWDVFTYTRGWLIYQEQLMQVLQQLGGFDIFKSDKVRRLVRKIGKSKTSDVNRQSMVDEAEEYHKIYLKHAIKKIQEEDGWSKKDSEKYAEEQWNALMGQAKYSFNGPHSYAYSLVGYVQGYLKAYYPVEFWVATLNTIERGQEKHNQSSLGKYIHSISRNGIKVIPPNVNKSGMDFQATEDDKIAFALSYIKNAGKGVDLVIENKPYENWDDFLNKAIEYKFNKSVVKGLIFAGATDFDDDIDARPYKWALYLKTKKGKRKNKKITQELNNFMENEWPEYFDLIEMEYDYCKYSFTGIDQYLENNKGNSVKGTPISERDLSKKLWSLVGYISDISTKKSKKSGNEYVLITVTDFRDSISIFAFGNEYRQKIFDKFNKGIMVKIGVKNDSGWLKLPWEKEYNGKFPIQKI